MFHVAEEYCWAMTRQGGRAAADQLPLCLSSNTPVFLPVTVSGITPFTGPRLLFALFSGLQS